MKRDSRTFDRATLYGEGPDGIQFPWPQKRLWQIYWFLVENGTATASDISFELCLPVTNVRVWLFRLRRLGLLYTTRIDQLSGLSSRSVYGPALYGLFYCESCEKMFLPVPLWDEKKVKHCPYCGTTDIVHEPRDSKGLTIADVR